MELKEEKGTFYWLGRNMGATFTTSECDEAMQFIRGIVSSIEHEWLPTIAKISISQARDAGYKLHEDYEVEE